jgi:NADPH:quinone reductase-like Zn-dependent oxidoreductase
VTPYSTFAERIPSPAAMRFAVPPTAVPEAVAGVNPGTASWLPVKRRLAETGSLGTFLILGVTRMSGFLAAQNARLLGATSVIGAGRNSDALERGAAAGARTVALSGDRRQDPESLASELAGASPNLVLDFVWGPVAESAFAALSPNGLSEDMTSIKYVQIGALGGQEAALPSSLLRSKKITISGSRAGSMAQSEIKTRIPEYIALIADGSARVPFRTFPLSDVSTAWAQSTQTGPRVVLTRD